jgi:nucleoside transporter
MIANVSSEGKYVSARLSAMMFLEFFIWGGWYVTVSNYMSAHAMDLKIALVFSLCPIAAIISPFFLGMVADRFFATEKVLAIMSLLSGVSLLAVPILAPGNNPRLFIPILLFHTLCYMPTLGLTSTLAFHHVKNPEKEFPIIRVFGTIGWIAANWVVSKMFHGDTTIVQFYAAGIAAIILGIYSYTLPHTPAPSFGKKATMHDILGLDSLALLKKPSFAIFILCSLLICIPLNFYYAYAPVYVSHVGFKDAAFTMSFGQIFEIFFMLLMPILFLRLGVKYMLFTGMCAWVVRYGLFAAAADHNLRMLVMLGIILHGVCYDFFFVTGQIYVDKVTSPKIRGQAQGFYVLITQGIGMLIGASAAGYIFATHTVVKSPTVSITDWKMLWLIPCIAAAVIAVLFVTTFNNSKSVPEIVG